MAGELGKNMTLEQFIELLTEIAVKHKWPMQGRGIKYVRPHFDTRTMDFYGVELEGLGGQENKFFVINENRNRDLFQWLMDWLREGEMNGTSKGASEDN